MKLIVITAPTIFPEEGKALTALFDAGLEILHLRKPTATEEEVETLVREIPEKYRGRIVVHDFFMLAERHGLRGIHLNGRHSESPAGYTGHVSCSCHSIAEVSEKKKHCNYVFLSPIYDSISKEGYGSGFDAGQLRTARDSGIIDEKVMALGGICADNLAEVAAFGFGGAAVLGEVWSRPSAEYIPQFIHLQKIINSLQ
jgi:thiamine-phosphate pyrophosphorylase